MAFTKAGERCALCHGWRLIEYSLQVAVVVVEAMYCERIAKGFVFAVAGLSVLGGWVCGCELGRLSAMEMGKENFGGSLSVIVNKILRV